VSLNRPLSSRLIRYVLTGLSSAFAFSWLSIPWIYPSEITPLSVRHIGAAVGTSAEWLSAFLIAEVTPVALQNIGWKFFLVFIVMW
jgi:hypothetical protein